MRRTHLLLGPSQGGGDAVQDWRTASLDMMHKSNRPALCLYWENINASSIFCRYSRSTIYKALFTVLIDLAKAQPDILYASSTFVTPGWIASSCPTSSLHIFL